MIGQHSESTLARLLALPLAAMVVASACAPAVEEEVEVPAGPVDVTAEIAAANETFMAAFSAGDAAGVAAMYTDDAVLYPPNSEALVGPEAIVGFFQGAMDAGIVRAILETTEALGMGDMAVEVGKVTLLGADGGTIDRASFMVLWKRTADGWRLHRDIYNSDLAAAP